MRLCSRCIYPDTRPDTHFDAEGVCSGCRSFEQRASIDWDARKGALHRIIGEAETRGAPYDAIVPVSGGKDSTFQVLTLVEMGAKVLAVNGGTDMLSDIGRRNLDNLKRFCDVLELTPNVEIRKKLVRIGLHKVGDMSWPEHCAIWAIPTRIAVAMGIPLIVWGEQPQREYACPEGVEPATELNARWVNEFGGMLGMRLEDCIGELGLRDCDLEAFRFPRQDALDRAGVKGIWLGDYLDWDGWRNGFIAQQHGFECLPHPVEGSLANYENLDNHVTVLRDYLRFLKYGYTRATDIACNHIRRGRLSRSDAMAMVQAAERFPLTSLGLPIVDVLDYFEITLEEFVEACNRFTNPQIFLMSGGKPITDDGVTPQRRERAD